MKKEDLIIDKLYIHSNDRKAYYRGEDDNYGSIFELVDDIGCSNLTSSFPHLKSIASNTYWGYSSLHEEFNEIEGLNLMKIQMSDEELLEKAKRDYPIGTEYYPVHLIGKEDYKCIMNEDSFNKLYISGNSIVTGKTNKDGWSEVVYQNDTWATIISKPEIKEDVIPEYVECIKQSAGFTKGKIYQITNTFEIIDDDNEVRNVKGYWKQEFSFSTREAYELQNKPKYEVVHCKTQKEWDFARANINENVALSSDFDKDGINCLQLNPISGSYSRLKFYQDHNSKIYTFQEWCELNNYKPEFMNETKFEVNKWYSFRWNWSTGYDIIAKVSKLSDAFITFNNFKNLTNGLKLDTGVNGINLSEIKSIKELSLEEIQQYLPEGHPDKIVDKSVEKWSVGSYIVNINSKWRYSSKYLTIGKVYEIIPYPSNCPYVLDDSGDEVNFDTDNAETNRHLKWFPTLQEAEEFAKTLKKEEMNEFKRGDYIVLLEDTLGNFKKNFCTKQSKDNSFLHAEITCSGKRNDGSTDTKFDKSGFQWRYATEQEIAEYDRIRKPYDVTTLNIKEEEWIPQVGDWVVVKKWYYAKIKLPQTCQILNIDINDDTPYKILLNKDHDGNNGSWYFKRDEFRKALPHEIPTNKEEEKLEKNISPIPEKWAIQFNNHWDILSKFKPFKIRYIGNADNTSFYSYDSLTNDTWCDDELKEGFIEITLEQFKKYVLKEDVLGYPLTLSECDTPIYSVEVNSFEELMKDTIDGLNLSLKKDEEENEIKIYNTNIKTLDLSLKNN